MTTEHSIADPCDPEVLPANNRMGTVSYASRYPDYTHVPSIIMKGQWLAAAGFYHRYQIRCQSDGWLYRVNGNATAAGRARLATVAASGL